jgi:hypothetical protein
LETNAETVAILTNASKKIERKLHFLFHCTVIDFIYKTNLKHVEIGYPVNRTVRLYLTDVIYNIHKGSTS